MVMTSLRNHVLSVCSKSVVLYQGDSLFHSYTMHFKARHCLKLCNQPPPTQQSRSSEANRSCLKEQHSIGKKVPTNKQLCCCRLSKSKKQHSSLVFVWYQLNSRFRDRLALGFSWSFSVPSRNGPAEGTPQTRQRLPTASFPVHYPQIVLPSDDAHLTLTKRRKINQYYYYYYYYYYY
jgi:hypothetical protein